MTARPARRTTPEQRRFLLSESHRGTGRTTAACRGAKETRAVVLTRTEDEATRLSRQFGVTAQRFDPYRMIGHRMAFVLEHSLVELFLADLEDAERELAEAQANLSDALDATRKHKEDAAIWLGKYTEMERQRNEARADAERLAGLVEGAPVDLNHKWSIAATGALAAHKKLVEG